MAAAADASDEDIPIEGTDIMDAARSIVHTCVFCGEPVSLLEIVDHEIAHIVQQGRVSEKRTGRGTPII